MKVSQMGEFRLLKLIEKKLRRGRTGSRVVVGIGDDGFAACMPGSKLLVVTNDVLVENTHFQRAWMLPGELGYKALAVNLSDLAAMGGAQPLYAFVGLALPGDTSVDFVDKLYIGMNKACKKFGFMIAGGDTVSSKKDIVISITLLGEIDRARLLTRSGAAAGELIFVTGWPGESGAGLKVLQRRGRSVRGTDKNLIKSHLLPEPKLKAAALLSATGKVTSMIDSSDGLAASLRFISERSSVGADISTEKIPVSDALRSLSRRNRNIDPIDLALNGGEDYELVFTVKPDGVEAVRKAWRGITCIGVVNSSGRIRYLAGGKPAVIKAKGYQAFTND